MTIQNPLKLREALETLEAAAIEDRVSVLLAGIIADGGHYLEPGKESHLFEASLLDVHARADSKGELVVNWMRAAENICRTIAHPGTVDEQRAALLDRARSLGIIASPNGWSHDAKEAACNSILQHSADPLERHCAAQMLAMLNFAAA